MHYNHLILIMLIACGTNDFSATSRLDGCWMPIILLNGNEKSCAQKNDINPLSIEIKNDEKIFLDVCNKTEFAYSVFENEVIIRDTGEPRTTILCKGFNGEIEDIWAGFWNYNISGNGDTLTLYRGDVHQLIKLIKAEVFDSKLFSRYYNEHDCKWQYTETAKTDKIFEGEPIYISAQVAPTLCSNDDPQRLIEENLFPTESMKKVQAYDKVLLWVLIDKCGKIRGFRDESKISDWNSVPIHKVLALLSCWNPAEINDQAVNIYYPLQFDFTKFK